MTAEAFLLDVMVGKLAVYLRMCGYDAAYALDRSIEADDDLRRLAASEGRTIITRDVDLAADADPAILLRAREIEGQLEELRVAGMDLTLADPPVRCGRCNGRLARVAEGAEIPEYVPDGATRAVWRCRACDQHFWRGSHWSNVRETLASE